MYSLFGFKVVMVDTMVDSCFYKGLTRRMLTVDGKVYKNITCIICNSTFGFKVV